MLWIGNYKLADCMTQNERWQKRYDDVVRYIKGNKLNPSKYAPDEKLLVHFLREGESLRMLGS